MVNETKSTTLLAEVEKRNLIQVDQLPLAWCMSLFIYDTLASIIN
jgi:hypothetical protein